MATGRRRDGRSLRSSSESTRRPTGRTMMRLIEPDRHEGLSAQRWDESVARLAIETIARDCEDRFSPDDLWPPHPLDIEGETVTAPFTMLYMGAAGGIWALDSRARGGMARPTDWFASTLAALEARNLAQV